MLTRLISVLPFLSYDNVNQEELGCNFVPPVFVISISSSWASVLSVPCKVTLVCFPDFALHARV